MSAVDATVDRVRGFLAKQAGGLRPVPIAAGIGEKDIRVVRQALERLERAGDLVTCTVESNGEVDKEYRLVTGGKFTRVPTYVAPQVRHRPDSSAIPSHFGKAEPAQPTPPRPGPTATRQDAIIGVIERADRPLSAQEILATFNGSGEDLALNTIQYSVWLMVKRGQLVEGARVKVNGARTRNTYATPAMMARRRKEILEGGDGEGTSPVQAITAEAARDEPTAPRTPVEAPQKTVHPMPAAESTDARTRLEIHFRANVGAWLSFRWLLPVAAGSAPDLMELLAEYQREGRLAFGVLDYNGPMWSPVEGRW